MRGMVVKCLHETFWEYVFPDGVVAIDADGPTPEYYSGAPLRPLFLAKIRTFAALCAEKWGLGRYWIYATRSGYHIVFENLTPRWRVVLEWAGAQYLWNPGIYHYAECHGHMRSCLFAEAVFLRISPKEDRPWDIHLAWGDGDIPDHLIEHHRIIESGGM